MKKRVLLMTAILALFFMAGILSGCGGSAAVSSDSQSGAEVSSDSSQVAESRDQSAKTTLETIQERGYLVCGVNASNPGFSYLDPDGNYIGFEADLGRAVAAAVLGDEEKIRFRPLTSKERFAALQSGEIDLLIRTATFTLTRDTDLGLNFTAPYYYDGQTFVVRKDSGVTSIRDLEGASICVLTGSTSESNLADYMAAKGISYKPVVYENLDELIAAFEKGRADAWTGDRSGLMTKIQTTADPDAYTILEETISKEPLAIGVRQGDDQWYDIVSWTLYALFFGEEHNITRENIDQIKSSTKNPEERSFLGLQNELGAKLGLSNDWAYQVISRMGNYSEILNRHLGEEAGLDIPRGLNKPWNDGGLLYCPPFR